MWQVELTPFTDTDRAIATSIVDAVDDTNYLTVRLKISSTASAMRRSASKKWEAVLKRIQRFDPVGIAAKICTTVC